jgi:hypothetical protein
MHSINRQRAFKQFYINCLRFYSEQDWDSVNKASLRRLVSAIEMEVNGD